MDSNGHRLLSLKSVIMKINIQKFSSVTKNIPCPNQVTLTDSITAEEGSLIAVEVLEDKKIYNQLELTSGRFSKLLKGDIIAVVLGNRNALKGFVGHVPEKIAVGDTIQLLNLGGVAGICESENYAEVGHALNLKVLGGITLENESTANIKDYAAFTPQETMTSKTPLILISGTCMNSGKTTVACEVIKQLTKHGKKLAAAKLAGVAALKDTENMKDHGAIEVVSFIDAGYASTVGKPELSPQITKGAIDYLTKLNPDFIVIEFGDGVLGEYGVMESLKDREISNNIADHIGCAHDPIGALKLTEICEQIYAPLSIISGPVTDNSVGTKFVKNHCNLPGLNALKHNTELIANLI